jgi:hypothetical protein
MPAQEGKAVSSRPARAIVGPCLKTNRQPQMNPEYVKNSYPRVRKGGKKK